ncbi:hypothetical protein VKT23_020050 [Stygiomarasmius scandens]|uniref:Uncharacterized protein n=1 Tax=Marasmiellus scandens TaxID=2682957 RepID=A0ABR1IP04_9AGAR
MSFITSLFADSFFKRSELPFAAPSSSSGSERNDSKAEKTIPVELQSSSRVKGFKRPRSEVISNELSSDGTRETASRDRDPMIHESKVRVVVRESEDFKRLFESLQLKELHGNQSEEMQTFALALVNDLDPSTLTENEAKLFALILNFGYQFESHRLFADMQLQREPEEGKTNRLQAASNAELTGDGLQRVLDQKTCELEVLKAQLQSKESQIGKLEGQLSGDRRTIAALNKRNAKLEQNQAALREFVSRLERGGRIQEGLQSETNERRDSDQEEVDGQIHYLNNVIEHLHAMAAEKDRIISSLQG